MLTQATRLDATNGHYLHYPSTVVGTDTLRLPLLRGLHAPLRLPLLWGLHATLMLPHRVGGWASKSHMMHVGK